MDSGLNLLADFSTIGLAVLGGYVAVKPPKDEHKKLTRLYIGAFIGLAIAGVGSNRLEQIRSDAAQEKLREKTERTSERFSADLKAVKDDDSAILRFMANPPESLTKAQVETVVKNWAQSILDKREVPPEVTNVELRRETFDYTKELRNLEQLRGAAYTMTMKPMNLQPGAEQRSAHWWAVEDQVKDQFRRNYRDRGIGLRNLLIKRLNVSGPPVPTILDEGVAIESVDIKRCYEELANYLDGLANKLPYP